MKSKCPFKRVLALVLGLALVLALSACQYSDTVVEINVDGDAIVTTRYGVERSLVEMNEDQTGEYLVKEGEYYYMVDLYEKAVQAGTLADLSFSVVSQSEIQPGEGVEIDDPYFTVTTLVNALDGVYWAVEKQEDDSLLLTLYLHIGEEDSIEGMRPGRPVFAEEFEANPDMTLDDLVEMVNLDEYTEEDMQYLRFMCAIMSGDPEAELTNEQCVETLKEMTRSAHVGLKFKMPGPATILDEYGLVSVDGNEVTLNVIPYMALESGAMVRVSCIPGEVTPQIEFGDVQVGSWYYDAVMQCAENGVMNGHGDGTFGPEQKIQMDQLCQVMYNFLHGKNGTVEGYWAVPAIEYCLENGLVEDLGEITPENWSVPALREQAVAALMKLGLDEQTFEVNPEEIMDLQNAEKVYQEAILAAYRAGLVHGKGDGLFDPKSELTRAELCQMVVNGDLAKK